MVLLVFQRFGQVVGEGVLGPNSVVYLGVFGVLYHQELGHRPNEHVAFVVAIYSLSVPSFSFMEGCAVGRVAEISRGPRQRVKRILDLESDQLEVTKSLVNILYNIVIVGSVPPTATQRTFFDKHSEIVFQLVSRSRALHWKKETLRDNISLVINIAASCHTVAGS